MERSSSPIENITIELLVKILNYVKYVGSIGSLYSCLRCCRQWRDLGLPFLYEGVALVNKETSRKFCRDRSLFSRKLEAATLLRAVPQTVENLEVNFGKKCRASHLEEHLCDEIRPHLKNVKRLRMRNSQACASLFLKSDDWLNKEDITPLALRSVIITSWQDEPFSWCYSEDEAANLLNIVCGRAFCLSGVLPVCKEFYINWVTNSKNEQSRGVNLQLFHFDVLRELQETYSMIKISKLVHGFKNFIMKGREEQMLYGNESDLIAHVEGELGFLKTSLGLRFSAAVPLKNDCCMKKSSLKHVDELLEDQSSPKSFRAALENLELPSITQRKIHLESFRVFPQQFWALGQYMIEVCERNEE